MDDPQVKKQNGGFRPRTDGQPRKRVENKSFVRGGLHAPVPLARPERAAVRAMYEGNPGATVYNIAEESGVPAGTIKRWKAEDGQAGRPWKPVPKKVPDLAGRAGALAATFRTKMSELGKPMSDEVAAAEATQELALEHAVNVRAAVLDRHRKEWAAPRRLAYDALQKGHAGQVTAAFEIAKLAKITSETLQIIQVGECRAFGMDHNARGADGGTVVMIERDGPGTEPTSGQMDPPRELSDMGQATPNNDGEF